MPTDQIAEVYQLYRAGTEQNYPNEELPIIRALQGERVTVDDVTICQNNQTIPIEVWGTPVFDEQGKVAYAIAAFQDITERRQAEKLLADYHQTLEQQVTERTLRLSQEIEERQRVESALRQSEEQRKLTMAFSHIGSWNWNILENTVAWDDHHFYLLGLVPGDVESGYQAWRDRVHPEDIDRVEQTIMAALATRTDYEAEYRVIYPNGSIRWLVSRGRGIFDQAEQPVQMLGVILDISEQRDAALRERKRAEHASILEERNRMAREIHDTLAQSFTGILLQVGAATQVLVDDLEAPQEHLEMLEMIDELARTGLAEARRSVAALRPQLLEEGNLQSALHRLVTQMGASTNTTLIYESKGIAYPLPTDVENHLLRMGQEALTNAIRYADASEIRVELVYEAARFTLCVQDNGRGFSVGSMPSVGGFGLLGMSERARQMGAQLSIQSQPGQLSRTQPDVILMDLSMPHMGGVEAIGAICAEFKQVRITVLTTYDGDEDIYRGLQAGAQGYLLKDAKPSELLNAIRTIHSEQKYVPPAVGAKLLQRMSHPALSERELAVLRLMAQGMSNADIATALSIGKSTVKSHINRLLSKLGVSDRTQAVIVAVKRGLVSL